MTTPVDILRTAANRVRSNWVQFPFVGGGGECALTAISHAAGRDFTKGYLVLSVRALMATIGVGSEGAVAKWNDAPGQTAENVAQALELAALIYEEQHDGVGVAEET